MVGSDEGYSTNLLIMVESDEGYTRNSSGTLNSIHLYLSLLLLDG